MDQQQDGHQHGAMELPPGFRFHPTDEELITHYLARKVADGRFSSLAVSEADLNKCEPWDLPSLARMGEKEWYFFVVKDRKYPTGTRTNRATEAGYWKATGKDKDVFRGNALAGMKKTLVFYTGRAPKGDKSGWVMHEYRLLDPKPHAAASTSYGLPAKAAPKNEWVLCRVFKKSFVGMVSVSSSSSAPAAAAKKGAAGMEMKIGSSSSTMAGDVAAVSDPLPPLLDISGGGAAPPCAFDPAARVTCFSNNALEAGQFYNPTAAGCTTDVHHHDLASSSPFLAGLTQYGPLHHGAVSLVQLLESNGYHRGLVDDMAAGKQQPAAACKGERERLMSASQDTGLTSDVNPEISSSSGQKFGHDQAALWGY